MSVEPRPPHLVQRAAALLAEARTNRVTPAARPVEPGPPAAAPVTPLPLSPAAPAQAEAPAAFTRHSKTVAIDPATLAANGIALPGANYGPTVEEFRVIKRHVIANASHPASVARGRSVMITSAKPGDGKTYTAINLALSMAAERDLKVLLIDADVYRQSIPSYLGVSSETGWMDCLSDPNIALADVLLHTNIPNLSVLPAGKIQANVPELMSSRRMSAFAQEVAHRYQDRFVIYDSLPCLASTEPSILAGLVGQALFVVSAHMTSRDDVDASLRLISACPSVNLILNRADPLLNRSHGKYGYGYGNPN